MGQKKVLPPFKLFAAQAVSSTNQVISPVVDVPNLDNIVIQASWTGTPTGTLSVEGSIDGTQWNALTLSPALSNPAGSASNTFGALNQTPFLKLRLKYTNSTGSGTLTALIAGKDLN